MLRKEKGKKERSEEGTEREGERGGEILMLEKANHQASGNKSERRVLYIF